MGMKATGDSNTGRTVRLRVAGAMAQGTANGALERAVAEALMDAPQRIIVDVSDVALLDASGIGELVACRSLAREAGASLRIRGAMGKVLEILRVTGLETVLLRSGNCSGCVHRIVA